MQLAGLSLTEFQGYVACVLTQILRELEATTGACTSSLDVCIHGNGMGERERECRSAHRASWVGACLEADRSGRGGLPVAP